MSRCVKLQFSLEIAKIYHLKQITVCIYDNSVISQRWCTTHSVHFSKSNEKDHRMSFAFRQKSDKKLGLIFYFKLLQQSLLKCNKWLMKQLLWHYISAKFFGNTFLYIFIK